MMPVFSPAVFSWDRQTIKRLAKQAATRNANIMVHITPRRCVKDMEGCTCTGTAEALGTSRKWCASTVADDGLCIHTTIGFCITVVFNIVCG
jgi:hypothetical protein